MNNHSAIPGADGTVRILVCHATADELRQAVGDRTLPVPNCLSTAGHGNGAMLLRYVGATEYPPVRTSVVPLATLLRAPGETLP
ncbi:MAG: hypothetical protein V2I26_06680 [Halieaceae bacterium]|nr:hypothetical protein [Halieaceae bacterium]